MVMKQISKSMELKQKMFDLMTQKGIFSYEFFDSFEKLTDVTELPPKDSFYSTLLDEGITDEQYQIAQDVWNTFECKTLKDYMEAYLETDVLMLCDIFEDFRSNCRDTFKLDPAHYVTGTSLSWNCILRFTKVELELLADHKMYDFLTSGIRGGFSTCPYRYAEANNKYM
jgi:hypothetical protein